MGWGDWFNWATGRAPQQRRPEDYGGNAGTDAPLLSDEDVMGYAQPSSTSSAETPEQVQAESQAEGNTSSPFGSSSPRRPMFTTDSNGDEWADLPEPTRRRAPEPPPREDNEYPERPFSDSASSRPDVARASIDAVISGLRNSRPPVAPPPPHAAPAPRPRRRPMFTTDSNGDEWADLPEPTVPQGMSEEQAQSARDSVDRSPLANAVGPGGYARPTLAGVGRAAMRAAPVVADWATRIPARVNDVVNAGGRELGIPWYARPLVNPMSLRWQAVGGARNLWDRHIKPWGQRMGDRIHRGWETLKGMAGRARDRVRGLWNRPGHRNSRSIASEPLLPRRDGIDNNRPPGGGISDIGEMNRGMY